MSDLTTEPKEHAPQSGYGAGQTIAEPASNRNVFEARLKLALEAGGMGAWEYWIPEGRVLWSETLERIHGLEPGTFGGTFEDYQRDIHPADRSRVLDTVSHTLSGEPHRLRYRIIRPDGELRWLEARGTLLRDDAGAPHRIVGVCMDVTERELSDLAMDAHRAELELQTEALRALNEQLRDTNEELRKAREDAEATEHYMGGVLGAITDPFVVYDRDWRFHYINDAAARVLAFSPVGGGKDLTGKNLWEMYPDLTGTLFEREMRRAQEEHVPVVFEEFYAGRAEWSEQRCYPLSDGGLAVDLEKRHGRKTRG